MRIQHNIMAMNAYRNYSNNTSALAKNLEKLSSGYRINRAGDDAAGLAISEKMRAQITALGTAQKNVKDGISLVKTAEGATQEVHDMLNRMVDLATQSANGTYQDKVDREAIEQEFNALKTEIDRIADASNFNGIKLLDGSLDGTQPMGKANEVAVTATHDGLQSDTKTSRGEYTFDLNELKLAGLTAGDKLTLTFGGVNVITTVAFTAGDKDANGNVTVEALAKAVNAAASITVAGYVMKATADEKTGIVTVTGDADPTSADATSIATTALVVGYNLNGNNGGDLAVHIKEPVAFGAADKLARGNFDLSDEMLKDGNQITIGTDTYTIKTSADNKVSGPNVIDLSKTAEADYKKEAAKQLSQMSNSKFDITADGLAAGKVYLREKEGQVDYKKDWDLQGTATDPDAEWKNTETGESVVRWAAPDTKGASGKALTLQIGEDSEKYNQLSVNIKDLHVAALGLDKHTLGTQEGAQSAVAAIKDAINTVSTVRSDLGATQNRLEHTANNLSTMKENIQDAESTIRDTDIAEEMMAYTKNNILVQSAQAMLAQANQIPQGVLQLLG